MKISNQYGAALGLLVGSLVSFSPWAEATPLEIADDSHPTLADLRPMAEYWAGTGLKFNFLAANFKQAGCVASKKTFLTCLAGLNALAAKMTPPAHLLPASVLEERRAEIAAELDTFGNFKLVSFQPSQPSSETDTSYARRFRAYQTKLRREQSEALAAYSRARMTALPFEVALATLKGGVVTPANEAVVTAEAINAQIEVEADPHSRISPIAYDVDSSNTSASSFIGVGILLQKAGEDIVVMTPIENSPAHRVGVFARDVIVSIDNERMHGKTTQDASRKILGEAGTPVTLRVRRGRRHLRFVITRERIVNPNVSTRIIETNGVKTGLLKLDTFGEVSACDGVRDGIQMLKTLGAESLIFDLRYNGGGYTDQAICIASLFLGRGKTVFSERALVGNRVETHATDRPAVTDLPMMTLINGGSASASEILSGALQDHGRSLIGGQRSFGKATVQQGFQYPVGGIRLWLTIARFYLPSGRTNQLVGISPDFEIPPVPTPSEDDLFFTREEDLYTNALPAQSEPWLQTRPNEIGTVQTNCAGYEGRTQARYDLENRGALAPDYQALVASELLTCSMTENRLAGQ